MKPQNVLSINGVNLTLFIENEKIKSKVSQIAEQLRAKYEGEIPVFLCVLRGAFIFAADLVRAYKGSCEISFIRLSSYEGTESTGVVKSVSGLPSNLAGRHVVVVEDIVDTGLTMSELKKMLMKEMPKSVEIATLFTKPSKLKCDVKVDYNCFEIPDKFIVGYGLDYNGLYRNLPDVYCK